ncbi:hypothetical protein A1WO_04326, partial [Escherichia coli KTE102]
SHWSTSKTPSYTKSVSWQHHLMSEENKENGFNHVKTFTKIIFIFSVLVFNDNESKITDAAVNLFIQI